MSIAKKCNENVNVVLLFSLGKGNEAKGDSISSINQQLSTWFNGRNDKTEDIFKNSRDRQARESVSDD